MKLELFLKISLHEFQFPCVDNYTIIIWENALILRKCALTYLEVKGTVVLEVLSNSWRFLSLY